MRHEWRKAHDVMQAAYSYRFLSRDMTGALFRTFVEAFSDYALDMSHVREKVFLNRALKNGVDFESSVGVFGGDRMVGYTLIGIDQWKGAPAAFDIGTGIVKRHRGKGLATGMFEYAVPRLREKGVRAFLLEVLQENGRAIKAYEKTGFRITREFDCFQLRLDRVEMAETAVLRGEIHELEREQVDWFEEALDWQPSWENSFASIKRIPDDVAFLSMSVDGEPAGILVYYPALTWIMCIAVKRPYRRRGIGTALVRHLVDSLKGVIPTVRLINVQHADSGMTSFLERCGFEIFVKQFEMELDLAGIR
jgi:ribosomal protein S18 acetylase RimI-like enzyme